MSARRAMMGLALVAACCSHAAPRPPVDDPDDDDDVVAVPVIDAMLVDAATIDAPPDVDARPFSAWDWERIRARSPAVQDPDPCKDPLGNTGHLECGSWPFWELAVEVIDIQLVRGVVQITVDRGHLAGLSAGWIGRGVDAFDVPDGALFEVVTVKPRLALLRGPGTERPQFRRMILWNRTVRDKPSVE